jgi:hypothetical protein
MFNCDTVAASVSFWWRIETRLFTAGDVNTFCIPRSLDYNQVLLNIISYTATYHNTWNNMYGNYSLSNVNLALDNGESTTTCSPRYDRRDSMLLESSRETIQVLRLML